MDTTNNSPSAVVSSSPPTQISCSSCSSDDQSSSQPKEDDTKKPTITPSPPKSSSSPPIINSTTSSSSSITPPNKDLLYQRWLSRIKQNWRDIQWSPDSIRNNPQLVLMAMEKSRGHALQFASPSIKDDKEFILNFITTSCGKYFGLAFRNVSSRLKNSKDIVLPLIKKDGRAYKHISTQLQNDKDIVLASVKKLPDNIKYIPSEELKRDVDVLIAAGMLDEDHDDYSCRRKQRQKHKIIGTKTTTPQSSSSSSLLSSASTAKTNNTATTPPTTIIARKIALSTRFSLTPSSDSEATKFTSLFKNSTFIKSNKSGYEWKIYAPNAFDKQSCDKHWTRFDWPCRGTKRTCRYKNKLTLDGHPTNDCCWRYSFRSQLMEAKLTGGFMLQLVEANGLMEPQQQLGDGQKIELDMSRDVKCKVFQVFRPTYNKGYELRFTTKHIDTITQIIDQWYKEDCCDMSVTVIRP